ncbi:Cell division protein kinase [Entamoeba marina]
MSVIEKNFSILNKLGEGTYGVVFKASKKQSFHQYVAIKQSKGGTLDVFLSSSTLREIALLKQLNHPNVISILEVINDNGINIVFDFYSTDLGKLLEERSLSKKETKTILYQILNSLKYIHSLCIIHRDIKPQNILLTKDLNVKLTDFGLATQITIPNRSLSTEVITLWYRPPELLYGTINYSYEVDLWSLGCVYGEMVKNEPIFRGYTTQTQLEKIFGTLGKPKGKLYQNLPYYGMYKISEYKTQRILGNKNEENLIKKLLNYDPTTRITADQALHHQLFWN